MNWKFFIVLLAAIALPSCSTFTFQGDYQVVLSKSSASGIGKFLGVNTDYCKLTITEKGKARTITNAELALLAPYCPDTESRLLTEAIEARQALAGITP